MSKQQRFRSAYDFGDTSVYGQVNSYVDEKTGEVVVYESMTADEFRHACDVNRIVEKWQRTGVLEHTARFAGEYGNFIGPESYHEAANRLAEANSMFETLPAAMRAEFGNDVGHFLAFVSDDDNAPRMRELGLLPKQAEPAKSETKSRSSATAPPERAKQSEGGQGESPGKEEASKEGS